jgi:hypothetical protein
MHLARTFALATAVLGIAATGATAASTPATLKLLSVQTQFSLSPQGAPKIGSRLIFVNALYNRAPQFGKPAGALVGSGEGVCTIVSHTHAQCTLTAQLPNGELAVMGAFILKRNGLTHTIYAIVGGTGAYANARGSAASRDVSQTKTQLDVVLTD